MIEARRQQLHFGEGLIAEEVAGLREDWMKHADQVLEDEQLVVAVYDPEIPRHNPLYPLLLVRLENAPSPAVPKSSNC